MAATFTWNEDTGTATGSPAKGTTRTTSGVSDVNWKNSPTFGTAYTAAPITAGLNSYQKVQFGVFSGTFNAILNGFFQHTAGAAGTGITLKGPPTMTADADRWLYVTPSATTDSALTKDMTTANATVNGTNGVVVWFGATGPEATGKAATMSTNPCYTNYLTTQIITTTGAAAGDFSVGLTLTLQYDEN